MALSMPTKTQALEFKSLTEKMASKIEAHVRPVKRISDYSNSQLRDILIISKKYYDAVMQIEGMNIDTAYQLFNTSLNLTVQKLIADFPEYSKYTPRQVKALALRTALGDKRYSELFDRQNEQLNALLEARELLQDQTAIFVNAIGNLGVGLNPSVSPPTRENGSGNPLRVISEADQNKTIDAIANIQNQLMPELDNQIERLCTYTFGLYDAVPFDAKTLPLRSNPAFLVYLGYIGAVTVGAFAVDWVYAQIEISSTALLKQRCKALQEQENLLWESTNTAFSDQNKVLSNIITNSNGNLEPLKLYFAETINFLIGLDIELQPLVRASIQTRYGFFEPDCGLSSKEINLVRTILSFMDACGVPKDKQDSVQKSLDQIRTSLRSKPREVVPTEQIDPLVLNPADIEAAPTKLIASLSIFRNFSGLTIKLSEEQIKQLSAQIERLKKESINSHFTDMLNSLARNTSTLFDWAVYPILAIGILWGGAKVYKVLKSED